MLLVTGASGQLGSLIHSRLSDRGLSPLAGTRSPQRFGAHGRLMDFDDEASLDLTGVQTMVLVSAGVAEDDVVIARHDRVIAAAEKHGVGHIVYTSLTGAGDHLAFAMAHRWTERRLKDSAVSWTILRNGLYAELFGQLAAPRDGVIAAPFGDGAVALVAREDLADIAALVAADPSGHRNKTYELAGTSAVKASELAARLGVAYHPMAVSDMREGLSAAGLLPFQPAMLLSMYAATSGGFLGGTQTDLESLLPHAPHDVLAIAASTASTG